MGSLARDEYDSAGDKQGCHPVATINVLAQEELSGDGVGKEGEGSGGWRDQANVGPGKGEHQAKEPEGHEENAEPKLSIAHHAIEDREYAVISRQVSHISDALHGVRDEHVANG